MPPLFDCEFLQCKDSVLSVFIWILHEPAKCLLHINIYMYMLYIERGYIERESCEIIMNEQLNYFYISILFLTQNIDGVLRLLYSLHIQIKLVLITRNENVLSLIALAPSRMCYILCCLENACPWKPSWFRLSHFFLCTTSIWTQTFLSFQLS